MNTNEQIEICQKYGADYQPLNVVLKLGVSENFFSGVLPLNGLRHPQERDTCGWYLWAGEELSEADDFFQPMHAYHLVERCPSVRKYLALPAGWRFLVAGDYEDVWFDAKLLEV
jgi:hypothetical protein